jgi:hypothetical protein
VKEEEELMAEIGFENENVKTERTTQGISVEPNALAHYRFSQELSTQLMHP